MIFNINSTRGHTGSLLVLTIGPTINFCEKSNGISVGLITFNWMICINVMLGFQIRCNRKPLADAVCGMRMIWFHTYEYPCVCTLFSFLSERKHPTLTSYSRISQLSPSDFVPVAASIATWSDSVCRIRSHSQPHDKSHAVSGHMESPSSVYMLFHFCRITHNACRLRYRVGPYMES